MDQPTQHTVKLTPAVVEGLKLVMERAEKEMCAAVVVRDDLLKSTPDRVWLDGNSLTRSVESHAWRIISAVVKYRQARQEYNEAALLSAVPRETSNAA